jgi:hypothetical protein
MTVIDSIIYMIKFALITINNHISTPEPFYLVITGSKSSTPIDNT